MGEGQAREVDRLRRDRARAARRASARSGSRGRGRLGAGRDRGRRRSRGDARQPGRDLGELVGDVDDLAGVPVAVGGDEQLRLDLAEAVEHAVRAEIGRARRPDRADRGGGEHRGDRLGHVRHQRRDAVARRRRRARGSACCSRETRAWRSRQESRGLDLVLAAEDDGVAVVVPARAGSRRSSACASGKKRRAGHPVAVDEQRPALVADRRRRSPRAGPRRRPDPRPTRHAARRSRGRSDRCGSPPAARTGSREGCRCGSESRAAGRSIRSRRGSGQGGEGGKCKKSLANPRIPSYPRAG